MPSNAPANVKISPTHAITDEWIMPSGGAMKDAIIKMTPNIARITPRINCVVCFFIKIILLLINIGRVFIIYSPFNTKRKEK